MNLQESNTVLDNRLHISWKPISESFIVLVHFHVVSPPCLRPFSFSCKVYMKININMNTKMDMSMDVNMDIGLKVPKHEIFDGGFFLHQKNTSGPLIHNIKWFRI
jgi:hypothetical protein